MFVNVFSRTVKECRTRSTVGSWRTRAGEGKEGKRYRVTIKGSARKERIKKKGNRLVWLLQVWREEAGTKINLGWLGSEWSK